MSNWTLDEGRAFAQKMERAFDFMSDGCRCHVGLCGSVLHKGSSTKDLDIIVFPRKKPKDEPWNWADTVQFIEGYFKTKLTAHSDALAFHSQYTDAKLVMFADLPDGKRVDFFFLS